MSIPTARREGQGQHSALTVCPRLREETVVMGRKRRKSGWQQEEQVYRSACGVGCQSLLRGAVQVRAC